MIARRVNGEAVVVLGWGRAILLQLAHPLVAIGVRAHGRFDIGPIAYLERMRSTITAMLSLTFGTDAEVRETAARINAIHARVNGRLEHATGAYPAGTPYSATDPALLTWVHATLVDSQLRAYGLFVGPLTADEQDQYCAEATALGPLLGVPAGMLPETKARLNDYLANMWRQNRLAVGETAQSLATALLSPPGSRLVTPVFGLGRLTTLGLLPEPIRDAYGFAWSGRQEHALRGAARVLRGSRRLVPAPFREWPAARRARARARKDS